MKTVLKIFSKIVKVVIFIITYVIQLFKANLLIAKEIISIHPKIKPGIIKLPVDVSKDHEILSLVNLISMTPGSLCIDISDDKKHMYIHEMYIGDVDKTKQDIKNNLEKKILEISR